MCVLLDAARRKIVGDALCVYQNELVRKKFTRKEDVALVEELLKRLVTNFSKRWNQERKRQQSMSTRAREILLSWGTFSRAYEEYHSPISLTRIK